jgi:tRNA(Ile)-lysidine synthase
MPAVVPTSESSARSTLPLTARRHPFVHFLHQAMGKHLQGRQVIGVSGGRDSLALLAAVVVLRDRGEGIEPIAVHVHHHLREAADGEAAHVKVICGRLGVECHCKDITPAAAPGNCAANARRMRYDALSQVAMECGAAAVIVAHHAQDQLETMIAQLCRGAGLQGLGGMQAVTELPCGRVLLRPLLGADRSMLESFCTAAMLSWCDDATNEDPATLRGWLREKITGPLMERFPDAAKRAAGTARDLSGAARQIAEAAEALGGGPTWSRPVLAAADPLIIATAIRRCSVERAESSDRLGRTAIESAVAAIIDGCDRPREFDLGGGVSVAVEHDRVTVR